MRIPFRRALLLAFAMAGCRHVATHGQYGFTPGLTPLTPDKGQCGPSFNRTICAYRPIKQRGEAERLTFV